MAVPAAFCSGDRRCAMKNQYLKPMLDPGSPRVFNVNEMTQRILAEDENASRFFRNKPLNTTVLIKDTVPEIERREAPRSIGTKLYFPFNDTNIYEGGRTIFLHSRNLESALVEQYGEGALPKDELAEDLRMLAVLNRLPSLDPFLMKDAFLREGIAVNDAYFQVSQEVWSEIEAFMLQQFEPLVKAAFPEAMRSDERARSLMDAIWEARDLDALQPLIDAFRLPQHKALDTFSSWRGIVYYSYQYQGVQLRLVDLIKWLIAQEEMFAGQPASETRDMAAMLNLVKGELRREWQVVERIVRTYRDAYDKMFKANAGSTDFLTFLNGSNETYWKLGNSLGKTTYGIYCWDVLSARFAGRKLPWVQSRGLVSLLRMIFQPEKIVTAVNW